MIINLIGIILSVLTTNYILYDFLENIYEIKSSYANKKYVVVFAFILFSTIVILINLLNLSTLNLIVNCIGFILISFLFYNKISLKQMLLANIIFLLLLIIGEVLVMLIINLFINQLAISNLNLYLYNFFKTTIYSMFVISTFRILKNHFLKTSYSLNIKQNFVIMIFLPLFSILIVYLLIILDNVIDMQIIVTLSIIVSIGLILLNVYLLKLFEYLYENNELKSKVILLQKQTEIQLAYYETLNKKQEEINYFTHDAKRHIQTIYNLYNNGKIDTATDYIKDFYKLIKTIDNSFSSNNKLLEVLINDKIIRGKEHNIEINVIDNSKSNLLFMDKIDLILVLSNLLDNALDATLNCPHKVINLTIDNYNNFTIINMQNPFLIIDEKKGKLFTTKKNHHGLGLDIVKKTIAKYNGNLNLIMEDNIFIVTILFPDYVY